MCDITPCTCHCNQPQFKFGDKVWYKNENKWVIVIRERQQTILVVGERGEQTWTYAEALSHTKPKRKVTRSRTVYRHKDSDMYMWVCMTKNPDYNIPATLTWEEEVDD